MSDDDLIKELCLNEEEAYAFRELSDEAKERYAELVRVANRINRRDIPKNVIVTPERK